MKTLSFTIKFFISFILMFLLIAVQLSSFVNTRLINSEFYEERLSAGDYFKYLKAQIDFGFKNLSIVTSVPEEVFKSGINEDSLKAMTNRSLKDTEDYMRYNTNSIQSVTDKTVINKNLQKYLNDYSQKNNLPVDDKLKSQIDLISADAERIISNNVILFNVNEVSKYGEFQSFRKGVHLISNKFTLTIVLSVFLILILLLLNKAVLRNTFLWAGSSFIAAALFSLIPSVLAMAYKIPYRFNIGVAYLKEALAGFTVGYIKYFLVTGGIYLLMGIILLGIYAIKRRNTVL